MVFSAIALQMRQMPEIKKRIKDRAVAEANAVQKRTEEARITKAKQQQIDNDQKSAEKLQAEERQIEADRKMAERLQKEEMANAARVEQEAEGSKQHNKQLLNKPLKQLLNKQLKQHAENKSKRWPSQDNVLYK